MAIGGAGNYGFLFNSTSTNNNAGLANALFGSKNTMLSDYSMIKSGAYKKLLTAYYKTQKEDAQTQAKSAKSTRKTADDTKTSAAKSSVKATEENSPNLVARSAAEALKNSVSALQNRGLYKAAGEDEKGNATYNRDEIRSAVKSFVSDYNAAVSYAEKTSSTTVKSRALDLVKATSANAKLLSEVGITVGKDRELVVDEEKLAKANVSKLTSLFTGSGSYASRISSSAANLSKAAYAAASSTSSYSQTGTYQNSGISSLLDQYL